MALTSGTRLGTYQIVALIGAGGMGEVYEAHDTKLERNVALKVLPEAFAHAPERLARFQREAKLLAALNHPNIATIHGLEQSGATHYLVMELVPGETLAQRVQREGPLPIEEALTIAKQIADALEAAHEKPIIHRDLKPANVKVTPQGRVKVLDFGLAKAFAGDEPADDIGNSPTLSRAATAQGVILGTAAYMSPEQARGKTVDKRTDLWAFGCLLYELLTGRQTFHDRSVPEILAAVLKLEPDWQALPAATPASVRALLRRCLQKDVNRRARDAGDLRIQIEEALAAAPAASEPPAAAAIPVPAPRRQPLPWVLAAGMAVAAVLLAFVAFRRPAPPSAVPSGKVLRFSIAMPPEHRLAALNGLSLAVSPDGTKLVYVGAEGNIQQLYLRSLDTPEAKPIPETEGALAPFFSPDDRWVAFFAGGKLKKASIAGGAALTLCDVAGTSSTGVWGPDNTILFTSTVSSVIWQVSADGGTPKAVTQINRSRGESNHIWPQFLPGGREIIYTVWTGPGADDSQLMLQSLRTGERRMLLQGATSQAFYLSSGYLVFIRSGTLMAVPFDSLTLRVSSDPPVPVLEGVSESAFGANFALSSDGTLAYVSGFSVLSRKTRMVEADRQGRVQPLAAPPGVYWNPRFSPDGKVVAVATMSGTSELWTYDLARGTLARLASDPSGMYPIWSPDGTHISYLGFRNGARSLFSRAADGTGAEEILVSDDAVQMADSWTPDGKVLAFHKQSPATGTDIWLLDLNGRQTRPLLQTAFNETFPVFSPDGRLLAYASDESSRREIYVQRYPGPGSKRQISTEGGSEPVWPRNGHELFFRNGNKTLAVEVRTEPTFSAGAPHTLFEGDFYRSTPMWTYDVSSDGQRFLFLQPVEPDRPSTQINVVLNWSEELKRRLPTAK